MVPSVVVLLLSRLDPDSPVYAQPATPGPRVEAERNSAAKTTRRAPAAALKSERHMTSMRPSASMHKVIAPIPAKSRTHLPIFLLSIKKKDIKLEKRPTDVVMTLEMRGSFCLARSKKSTRSFRQSLGPRCVAMKKLTCSVRADHILSR